MTEGVTPTPRRVWPLAAMAMLIALLATFLVVRFTRPADDTVETVQPPAPPPPRNPDPPALDPSDQLLAEAEAAIKAGRWDEAAAKAEQAKPKRPEAAAALLARIEEGRTSKQTAEARKAEEEERKRQEEIAAREKARLQRDQALEELALVTTTADAHVAEYRWDAALAVYEDILKKHPMLGEIDDYVTARRRVEKLRGDAAKAFAGNAERSRAELKAGRFAAALKNAQMATSLYPENPAGAALIKEITGRMLEANLVPIPATIKGGVKLGMAGLAEEPERVFNSPGFLMDKFEVTNEEYHLFVLQTGHRSPPT